MNKIYEKDKFNVINDHKTTLLPGLDGLAGHSPRATASHRGILFLCPVHQFEPFKIPKSS